VRETKDPEFFETKFTLEKFPFVKACVSWSKRVFSSFRRN